MNTQQKEKISNLLEVDRINGSYTKCPNLKGRFLKPYKDSRIWNEQTGTADMKNWQSNINKDKMLI